MVRNARLALLATVAVAFTSGVAQAGSANSYSNGTPSVMTYAAPAAPQAQPYYAPAPAPAVAPRDGYYDNSMGNNETFGYQQSHACGGVLDGEKCLVILNDHMRRVRLSQPAGTILVGNPTIADVTVLGNDTMFVSARSIGATNIIALDKDGNEIVTYEVFVKEPKTKRVVLRNAGFAANYQCTPDCERALTQSDDAQFYNATAGQVGSDMGLDQQAIGMQSGSNPNTTPTAGVAPVGGQSAGGMIPGGQQQQQAGGNTLTGSIQSLGAAVSPVTNIIGGGSAPVRTDAPALPN